jgi:hypothetical protein
MRANDSLGTFDLGDPIRAQIIGQSVLSDFMFKKRLPIRNISLSISNSKMQIEKKLNELKKVSHRKQTYNRLKMLDSVGQYNPKSNSGSIRKGYFKKMTKSIDQTREISKSYYNFLEDKDLQTDSYDTIQGQNNRYKTHDEYSSTSIPKKLEYGNDRRRGTKDYSSVSTNLTSEKKTLEAKYSNKRSVADTIGSGKYTPSSTHSLSIPDSFNTYADPISGGISPTSHSKVSIRVGK